MGQAKVAPRASDKKSGERKRRTIAKIEREMIQAIEELSGETVTWKRSKARNPNGPWCHVATILAGSELTWSRAHSRDTLQGALRSLLGDVLAEIFGVKEMPILPLRMRYLLDKYVPEAKAVLAARALGSKS